MARRPPAQPGVCSRCGGPVIDPIDPGSAEYQAMQLARGLCSRCESARYRENRQRLGYTTPDGRGRSWNERALSQPLPADLVAWGWQRGRRAASRARVAGCERVEIVSLFDLAERDGWVCQLCNEPVDPRLASFDHVTPLVVGGEHTADNLRLAHVECNAGRGVPVTGEEWTAWYAALPELLARDPTINMRRWLAERRSNSDPLLLLPGFRELNELAEMHLASIAQEC